MTKDELTAAAAAARRYPEGCAQYWMGTLTSPAGLFFKFAYDAVYAIKQNATLMKYG